MSFTQADDAYPQRETVPSLKAAHLKVHEL
jgi:hypothetical protein